MNAVPRREPAPARDAAVRRPAVAVRRYPSDLLWLGLGVAVLLLSALPVHRRDVVPVEADAFGAVNHLPSLPFAIVWVPMQLGNFLVVPLAVVAALVARRWRLAIGLGLAGVGVYALAKVVKHFVVRGRPDSLLGDVVVRGAAPHGLGYVSGHIGWWSGWRWWQRHGCRAGRAG